MSVRRQINRYRTSPSGYDYMDVLRRGKRFFTGTGGAHYDFEITPFLSPGSDKVLWTADYPSPSPFTSPKGTVSVRWDGMRWTETQKE